MKTGLLLSSLIAIAPSQLALATGVPSGRAISPTRANPARFHIRVDASPSMADSLGKGGQISREEGAKQATNRLLFSLVSANIVGSDIHDRATVTVKRYHGYEFLHLEDMLAAPAANAGLKFRKTGEYSLSDLAAMIPDELPEGHEPVWIETAGHGPTGTPTRETMEELADGVTDDVKGRAVFLVHLSDGEANGSYAAEVHRWADNVISRGGSPLATNVFIDSIAGGPLIFPTPEQAFGLLGSNRHFAEMWEASSEMPDAMARRIEADFPELKIKEGEHRRLIAYGVTDLEQLKAVFKAGSSSAAGF